MVRHEKIDLLLQQPLAKKAGEVESNTVRNKTSSKSRARVVASSHPNLEQQVSAIGRKIQREFGVLVVPTKLKSAPNPYAMSAEEAGKIMKKAGILTRAGNLSPSYK